MRLGLRGLQLASAGIDATPVTKPAACRENLVMTQIAIIGAGYWGPNLIRNFYELPDSQVTYVCDLNPAKLAPIKARYPAITTTTDYAGILRDENVEAIVIATPVFTHDKLALEALKAGKHVLVEKPLAASSRQAEAIIAGAESAKRVLMVGHTFVYNPAVSRVKELVDCGAIGDVYYIDSSRVNLGLHQHDVNVIWDLGPHDVSIILSWIGAVPRRVSARGNWYILDGVEDVAFLTLEFDNKLLGHVHISWLAPAKLRRITLIGSKQMIVYDDLESAEKVKVYDRGVEALQENPETRAELQRTYRIGDIFSPHVEVTEPLHLECAHFLECIRKGKRPLTDGAAGLAVVKVLEAATQSLRAGGRVVDIN
jgi:predicted dehydrogenase